MKKENKQNTYSQVLLQNYRHPYHRGEPENFSHSGKAVNRACGDEVEVFINIESNAIVGMYFQAQACALTIATASALARELEGKAAAEVDNMDLEYIKKLVQTETMESRESCLLLPLQAVQQALAG